MFTYEVSYLISPGSWHINEDTYICKTWCKFYAWLKWLKETKGHRHYSSYEYRHNYFKMRKDIKRRY